MTLLVLTAFATESNRAWTGVGVQGIYSVPEGRVQGEMDVILSERLRWGLYEGDALAVQARVDGRSMVDPFRGTTVESARVSELGVHLSSDHWAVDLGRSPVLYGGPRLVDGVQVLHNAESWSAGFWLGEAPDLFTTRPAKRGGGGPILVYALDRHQVSLVGEFLTSDAGFDRAGVLVQSRSSLGRRLFVDTRVDLQTVNQGTPIADAAVFVRFQPSPSLRLMGFYDAHSTWRYQATQERDLAIQRFDKRSQTLGLSEDIPTDSPDPTLYQLVGGTVRWDDQGAVHLQLDARYRHHALADRRYARVGPRLGIQANDALLVTVDAFALYANEAIRYELGVTAWYQSERPVALDGSARLLLSEQREPGFYADGFVNWIVEERDLGVAAGVYTLGQTTDSFTDTAFGGLARVSWRFDGG